MLIKRQFLDPGPKSSSIGTADKDLQPAVRPGKRLLYNRQANGLLELFTVARGGDIAAYLGVNDDGSSRRRLGRVVHPESDQLHPARLVLGLVQGRRPHGFRPLFISIPQKPQSKVQKACSQFRVFTDNQMAPFDTENILSFQPKRLDRKVLSGIADHFPHRGHSTGRGHRGGPADL